jgi:uncharacterized protein (TIGR03084 family)
MRALIEELAAEQAHLDSILSDLNDTDWDQVTAAAPWTIRDTVAHLAFFDERQTQAIEDPAGFAEEVNERLSGDYDRYMGHAIDRGRSMEPAGVLAWWREARKRELEALATTKADQRLAWYGPPMKAESAITARLMETWAHGHDIVETLGIQRSPTTRLFRIAELGVKTYSWSFLNRGLLVPTEKVRVALRGPAGSTRVWNDGAANSITGPVEEFCLVVAQRINYRDTNLVVEGELAQKWMETAQIFAGPPGAGRSASRDEFPIYPASHSAA